MVPDDSLRLAVLIDADNTSPAQPLLAEVRTFVAEVQIVADRRRIQTTGRKVRQPTIRPRQCLYSSLNADVPTPP